MNAYCSRLEFKCIKMVPKVLFSTKKANRLTKCVLSFSLSVDLWQDLTNQIQNELLLLGTRCLNILCCFSTVVCFKEASPKVEDKNNGTQFIFILYAVQLCICYVPLYFSTLLLLWFLPHYSFTSTNTLHRSQGRYTLTDVCLQTVGDVKTK